MADLEKMWKRFDEIEKSIIFYLIHAIPPVSIDVLVLLSGAPIITVLSLLEGLRKKKIVCKSKGYKKGLYFLVGTDLTEFVQELMPEKDHRRITKNLLDYYTRSLDEGREKTLILAELYRKLGDMEEGLNYVKDAADILFHSGDKEKAIVYYDHILEYFENKGPTSENVTCFLESVLVKLSASKRLRPAHEHMALLDKADKVAKRYKKWELLARIKLELVSELLVASQTEQAATNITDFRKFARKMDDPAMLKIVALATSEICFWQGRILEATRSYEEVMGDIEEFGNDERTLRLGALVGWCYVICGRIARGMGMIDAIRTKAHLLGFLQTAYIANIMKVHALLEIRKISEAEAILDSSTAPQTYGNIYDHLVSWTALTCRAYIHCVKEDYEEALACYNNAVEDLPSIGWMPRINPWTLEYLGLLEAQGLSCKKMDYQAEIRRALNGNDIYIKGFALRYRALMNIEKNNPSVEALTDLRDSEKYLKEAGAEIELARTRLALGDYYLKKGNEKTAKAHLKKAWRFFSNVDKNLFPSDLMSIMPREEKIDFMIDRIGGITRSLGAIRDRSSFLDSALNVAMEFTMATRGGVFASEADGPKLIASRNVDSSFLTTPAFGMIKQAIFNADRGNREVIIPMTKSNNSSSIEAVQTAGITSLIGMPVRLGGHVYGYLCLDNRLDGIPFPEDNLPFLRILCDQIAVGLLNINMYNEMKELKDRFEEEASFYKQEMGVDAPLETIIGQSEAIHRMTREIRQVARTDSSILILGETGVGKELVAKAIHGLSDRKNGPFIPVNLAVLPQDLVASELFGHERGAFTGAKEGQKGRFELADGGTIFLDEIGDLPLNVQVKLLRVLQDGTFERLGGSKPIKSNFRVISATNKDLRMEVEKGTFRQDLYFRLNVFPIYIPPLRDRKDDILLLARFFIERYSRKLGKDVQRIPPDELKKLFDYHWPGNIRELEHFIERAIVLSDGHRISFSQFEYIPSHKVATEDMHQISTLADMEREYIVKVLNRTNWKVSGPYGAASLLGLKSSTLVSRIKKLGIKRP